MFNFTTTTVINSSKDYTSGKDRWIGTAADNSQNIVGSLNVLRVMNFKAPNVTAIYKAVANDPEMAKVTFDFATDITADEGDQFRLSIYVGLRQASQDSRYSNDLILKGKPFTVDFIWKSTAAETVKSLVNTINKYMVFVYGSKLLNVSYSGAFLTLEATSEYQIFRKLDVEKLNATDHYYMGSYKTVKTLDSIAKKNSSTEVSAAEGYFVGKEGFGTYSYVLHNLRIPTSANTRAFRVYEDEAPIVGAKYNQYTIHYCTNRGQLGLNAVGDTVKSVTTHVFYVNQNVASSFETALAKIGTVLTVAPGTKTPDPGIVNVETLSQEVTQLKAQVAAKQDKLTAGNGINIAGNTASVKIDGDTLTASANGLKVTDGKFTAAQ